MTEVRADRGSFRDPNGHIYISEGRVYRTVMPRASSDFNAVRIAPVWEELLRDMLLLPEQRIAPTILGDFAKGAVYVLEHPRLPYISYPYEWSFPLLKAAALLHLDIHLRVLVDNLTLTDASAYNIQFQGSNPVFMDHLSFRPYREGEFWLGHRQFCEQFLNPLLMRAILGVPHNAWYRGGLEGIPVAEINRLIPWNKKLSWNLISHVSLQAYFQQSAVAQGDNLDRTTKRRLPKEVFLRMLTGLRSWIEKMEPADTGKSEWGDYAQTHSYTEQEVRVKKRFVHDIVTNRQAKAVWDIGCNTGDYAKVAIEAGADLVVGFDSDQRALEVAYARARSERLPFLPLYLDAANPSPDQGWAESERLGFGSKQAPDAVIALALIHHLAIGRNIPLPEAVCWLVSLSPAGVVEFVPKNDPMVRQLLQLREDIFDEYTEEIFIDSLEQHARIVKKQTVSTSGRLLVCFERDGTLEGAFKDDRITGAS